MLYLKWCLYLVWVPTTMLDSLSNGLSAIFINIILPNLCWVPLLFYLELHGFSSEYPRSVRLSPVDEMAFAQLILSSLLCLNQAQNSCLTSMANHSSLCHLRTPSIFPGHTPSSWQTLAASASNCVFSFPHSVLTPGPKHHCVLLDCRSHWSPCFSLFLRFRLQLMYRLDESLLAN